MKTSQNILAAFILNLIFSAVELIGGILSGSVSIISDAVHDFCDAVSIGLAFLLEKKSTKTPDSKYSYGYGRYSVIGALITTLILLSGSATVIYNAVIRIIHPAEINYNGMIILAIIGAAVNFCAAYFTSGGNSLNQRAVNLHMLEDVAGWLVVLIGAVIMRFTDNPIIDPIMSIGVTLFIVIAALRNLASITEPLLEKTPADIDIDEIQSHLEKIDGVESIHHIHIWSIDFGVTCATLHAVTDSDQHAIKKTIRDELAEHGIMHAVIETDGIDEICCEAKCGIIKSIKAEHRHPHHH